MPMSSSTAIIYADVYGSLSRQQQTHELYIAMLGGGKLVTPIT